MGDQSGLTVRRFSRHAMRLDALVSVSGVCSSQVRLTPTSGVDDGWVPAAVVDAGEGGLGLECGAYFPRRCIVHVKVLDPDGGPEPLLATDVRVQRVAMRGAGKGYALGTAFVDRAPSLASGIRELLARFERAREDAA